MKLSVCIPVCNFDVRELVYDLKKQIKHNGIDAEIILIDDASCDTFKTLNQELVAKVQNFIFLEKNIGRSKIRNLFLGYTQGDYLLFLDCDGKVIDSKFLTKYIEFLKKNPETAVLYGGRTVTEKSPGENYILRWKFAVERENLSLAARGQKPYLSFQTNNFIIKREVFDKVKFNSNFENYGYEDLLFAMDLKTEHVKIDHTGNPIFNNDLECNEIYLGKVSESVESLSRMLKTESLAPKISDIKLVKAFQYLKKIHFDWLFSFLFTLMEKGIENNLLSTNPNLRNLDFYKLGLLLRKMR